MCISCTNLFHKKCLTLTPKTFKIHVSKNFLCVDCPLKNLLFYEISDSGDYFPTSPKGSFPSNDQLKVFNSLKLLEITMRTSSKLTQNILRLKILSIQILMLILLSLFQANIASLNKYLHDLHNFLRKIKLQIQIMRTC